MTDKWQNIKNSIEYSNSSILSKVLAKGRLNITLFCMAAGTDIEEHTSTKVGAVFVLEGNGTFTLEGKDIEMKSGVLIQMPENAVHSLKAVENTAFLLVLG